MSALLRTIELLLCLLLVLWTMVFPLATLLSLLFTLPLFLIIAPRLVPAKAVARRH